MEDSPYVCSFICPSVGPWTAAMQVSLRSDPAPGYSPNPALSVPFSAGRFNRMYILTILLTDGQHIRTFLIFIPLSTLISHIKMLSFGDQRCSIPWEDWGPEGTRIMPSMGESNIWVCYVYGMRFVAPQDVAGTGSSMIRVYDFNPVPFKRPTLEGRQSHGNTLYMTETTSIDTQGAFEDILATSLPYRMTRISLQRDTSDMGEGRFDAVMCSEDNLIIVGVSHFSCLKYLLLKHI